MSHLTAMRTSILRTIALVSALLTGCTSNAIPGIVDESLGVPADDNLQGINYRGPLTANAVRAGSISSTEIFGFELDVVAGARFDFEVTQSGSSRSLDTELVVYRRDRGGFVRMAYDDDAGYGKLSRLRGVAFQETGRHLVVLRSRNRGNYRLTARCRSAECLMAGTYCPEAMLSTISSCTRDRMAEDGDLEQDFLETAELCADAEVLATPYDAMCARSPRPAFCGNFANFSETYAWPCIRDGRVRVSESLCTLGRTYREILTRPWIKRLEERTLTAESLPDLSELEARQIVVAADSSSYGDATTAADVFEAVDEGQINQVQFWDASTRRAFTAYEYGAGDNSYGAVFGFGTVATAALIQDADLYECYVTVGPEQRVCYVDSDCGANMGCVGARDSFRGVCVRPSADNDNPVNGLSCDAQNDCGYDSGFMCSGLSTGDEGFCLPSWMQGHFRSRPQLAIPDNRTAGATATLLASGLTTVNMDVWLDLYITHPRMSDLTVTLVGPGYPDAATEVTIFDGRLPGSEDLSELSLRDFAVRGLPGDESVNGVWRLNVVDRRRGQTGTIQTFGLRINSRWD